MKRVREVFETKIEWSDNMQMPFIRARCFDDGQFQVGEVVRVTVERLPAKRKGKRP